MKKILFSSMMILLLVYNSLNCMAMTVEDTSSETDISIVDGQSEETVEIIEFVYNNVEEYSVKSGDQAAWNDLARQLMESQFSFFGVTASGEQISLIVKSMDFSMVEIETPGFYPILFELDFLEATEEYALGTDIANLELYCIEVGDSNLPELSFVEKTDAYSRYNLTGIPEWYVPNIYYVSANGSDSLTEEDLALKLWEPCSWDMASAFDGSLYIHYEALEYYYIYYLRVEMDGNYSNIIKVERPLKTADSGGDQNTDDRDEQKIPEIIQPVIPVQPGPDSESESASEQESETEQEPQTENISESDFVEESDLADDMAFDNTVTFDSAQDTTDKEDMKQSEKTSMLSIQSDSINTDLEDTGETSEEKNTLFEQLTSTKTIISRARLQQLIMLNPNKITFEKNGISVKLETSMVKDLDITANELFEIEIQKNQNGFSLNINVGSKNIEDIPGTTVLLPYDGFDQNAVLLLKDEEGNQLSPVSIDKNMDIVSFEISHTGDYILSGIEENMATIDENPHKEASISLWPLNVGLISSVVICLVLKKKGLIFKNKKRR